MAEQDRTRKFRGLIVFAVGVAAILLVDRSNCRWMDLETYKILLQFVLVTLLGGLVFLLLAEEKARNEAADKQRTAERAARDAKVAALQALDRDLDKAYRALKAVKRGMRARLLLRDKPEWEMSEADFTAWMDKLLSAQLDLERVRESIANRHDLLDAEPLGRIHAALRYASRYYHYVFEDYEDGRASIYSGNRRLGPKAAYTRNFLQRSEERDAVSDVTKSDLATLSDEDKALVDRWGALKRLFEASQAAREAWEAADKETRAAQKPLRYDAVVAAEAIGLASAELRARMRSALAAEQALQS